MYVSDPIETLPKAVSNATVTATIDKYFNGDDLYALDNEKYADCRGQAYVMVTFAAENAKEWYGTMIAEDPNDPTSAIPDDEVIENVVGRRYVVSYRQALPVQMGYGAYDSGRRCRCGRESGCTVASEPHLHQGGSVPRFRIRGTRIAGRAYRDDENRSARGFCQELQVTDD